MLILAQRLGRRVCKDCKEPYEADEEMLVPDRLDGALVAHFTVHVRTPGSTKVRLTSWLSALRSASCTA